MRKKRSDRVYVGDLLEEIGNLDISELSDGQRVIFVMSLMDVINNYKHMLVSVRTSKIERLFRRTQHA